MTSMNRWQNTVVTDLTLASSSNVAIYGGQLVVNYAGISNTPADADIVTVWYDTNDWKNNQTLGDITSDSTTPTDFYGALKYVCEWLGTNRPYAKVIMISSPKRFDSAFVTTDSKGYQVNNNGDTLEDFANAIKEVAELYSYPYLDFFHNSGINANNASAWLDSDMLHPNQPCGIKLGHMIAEKIRES